MLNALRRGTNTWPVRILLILIVASFALWGVQAGGLGGGTLVGEVGDMRVDQQAFNRAYAQELSRVNRERDEPVTQQEGIEMGVAGRVLDQLLIAASFDQAAKDLGLRASDRRVQQAIQEIPVFLDPDGRFDRPTYIQQLELLDYPSGSAFEEQIRRDLARIDLVQGLQGGVSVPPQMIQAIYDFQFESRQVQYFEVLGSAITDLPEPDEAALMAFYEADLIPYTAPEYRNLSFIAIQQQDVIDTIEVTEDMIRDAYDERLGEFRSDERRTIQVIRFDTQDDADAAKTRIDAGLDFVAAGQEAGQSAGEITVGSIDRTGLDYLGPGAADAAFALPENGVSDPVETDLGWALVRASDFIAAEEISLEEARQQLIKDVAEQEARFRVEELANLAIEEVATGAPLEAVSETIGLPVQRLEEIDRAGLDPSGDVVLGAPASRTFFELAFAMELGEEFDVQDDGESGYYIIRLDDVTEAAPKPFREVERQVRTAYMAAEQRDAARQIADEATRRINAGEDFGAVAESIGVAALRTPAPIFRNLQNAPDSFSFPLVSALFETAPGTAVEASNAFDNGYVVAETVSIQEAPSTKTASCTEPSRPTCSGLWKTTSSRSSTPMSAPVMPSRAMKR